MSPSAGILLIGPPGCGKSTLAYRLSQRLGWPVVSLDALGTQLRPALGMDCQQAENLYVAGRVREWLEYVRPFDHKVLEIAIGSFSGCVFDSGAGHVLGRVGLEPQEDLSHLPDTLAAALRRFRPIVRVRAAFELPIETGRCMLRLRRRLERLREPEAYRVAAETAGYFQAQAQHYEILGDLEVCASGHGSRETAEELIARLQANAAPFPTRAHGSGMHLD